MKKPVLVVVAGERQQGLDCCRLLEKLNYGAVTLSSLAELEGYLQKSPEVAVILDLDTVPADNQFLRSLKRSYSRLHILGISSRPYHPGLEEVIGSHLYACLVKPLDTEELGFWLKTIAENLAETESLPVIEGLP